MYRVGQLFYNRFIKWQCRNWAQKLETVCLFKTFTNLKELREEWKSLKLLFRWHIKHALKAKITY